MRKRKKGFVVAAPSSGSGKTVVSLGLMEALRRRGLCVQPFKAGPDYIDPGHHASLLNRPSYNLDTWMMGPDGVAKTFRAKAAEADVSVVEGVMGLFDGRDGRSEEGSTAHLAKLLSLPVILVVDAARAARSVGAVIKGFEEFDAGVDLKWVVFNRVGSERHYSMLKDSIPKGSKVRSLGYIPRDASLVMDERHLGLVTSSSIARKRWLSFAEKAGTVVEQRLDLDMLLKGSSVRGVASPAVGGPPSPEFIDGPLIAVALDRAFCFYYEENLDILRSFGARIVRFSPIKDKRLPEGAQGVYIGGGYPELFAPALEKNASMREEIKRAAGSGLPILAECGGLMYLGRTMEDLKGGKWAGVGVFPWASRMLKRRAALGYREISVKRGCALFPKGGALRGHEFHYSEISAPPERIKRAFRVKRSDGTAAEEGYSRNNVLASYIHIHFASNPAFAKAFVRSCAVR